MDAGFPADVVAAARDAVKTHLRSVGDGEDALISQHAVSALALCEAFTGQATIVRTHVAIVSAGSGWRRLAMAPVVAITTVEGLPAEGASFAFAADAYAVDIDANGEGWVRVLSPGAAGRARVTYQAGLAADWAGLPAPIAQGVVLLAAHLFAGATSEPPAAVTALWRPWRRVRLSAERAA
ncbi:head-tail connector protein [Sphingomonas sp. LT1P40]|uniref:head-tail connector protein n=1 Tax=Alteristakelama amylovorans TaxID=3096166 RepID=UPI002FC683FE